MLRIVRRLPVTLLALLGACTERNQPDELNITARLSPEDSLFGSVEVRGLPPAALREPGPSLLLVQAIVPGDTSVGLPPVAGRHIVENQVLRFLPRYRPAAGLTLRVTLNLDSSITREFAVPEAGAAQPSVVVSAIYPSADTVPANHLRWYIEFSGSMRQGEAEQNVHLLDASGREVEDAFLIVSDELWDPERRRLTLLFDPGRVKRGVRQNLESGAPLVAGRDYILRINPAWRDGRGAPLVRGTEKRFHVIAAVRTPLDPAGWRIEAPRSDTRDPVTIDFARALDKALAERMVVVMAGEAMVTGKVSLAGGERRWKLEPDHPWPDREFEVRVSPLLEDPAGNRIGQNFDRDRATGEWQKGEAEQAVTIRFRPLLYSPPRAR